VGFSDGRVTEIAIDHFAPDDDGAVWYFGEDVSNYENGVLADHEGSWMAGKNGRAAMIMPAKPATGDVYRPENSPALVFEEDTVQATGMTVAGPRGPVPGSVRVEEHLKDDTFEHKVYAPQYGEFDIQAPDEHTTVALALPVDAATTATPPEVDAMSTSIRAAADGATAGDWAVAAAAAMGASRAWDRLRASGAPPLLADRMTTTLASLGSAIERRSVPAVAQSAIDASHASLDLASQYRTAAEVDRARLALWARQASVDAAAARAGAVAGDLVVLDAIRDRSGPADRADAVGVALAALRRAVGAKRLIDIGVAARALEAALS
jgi:hypothetical protein